MNGRKIGPHRSSNRTSYGRPRGRTATSLSAKNLHRSTQWSPLKRDNELVRCDLPQIASDTVGAQRLAHLRLYNETLCSKLITDVSVRFGMRSPHEPAILPYSSRHKQPPSKNCSAKILPQKLPSYTFEKSRGEKRSSTHSSAVRHFARTPTSAVRYAV